MQRLTWWEIEALCDIASNYTDFYLNQDTDIILTLRRDKKRRLQVTVDEEDTIGAGNPLYIVTEDTDPFEPGYFIDTVEAAQA